MPAICRRRWRRERPDFAPSRQRVCRWLLGVVVAVSSSQVGAETRRNLDLNRVVFPLPGAPVSVLPTDLDSDGRADLAIVVAYREWDQITVEQSVAMDEVDGLVEMMTIVPALADRRSLHLYLAREGGFEALEPVELDLSVQSVFLGPGTDPLLALTDRGIEAARLVPTGSPAARFELLVATDSVLAGTQALIPDLGLSQDVDGDGWRDVLVPRVEHIDVFLGTESGLAPRASGRLHLPPRHHHQRLAGARLYPLPSFSDVDGDRRPDALFRARLEGWRTLWVARAREGGRFGSLEQPQSGSRLVDVPDSSGVAITVSSRSLDPPRRPVDWPSWEPLSTSDGASGPSERRPNTLFFGDLDGDGRAEYATLQDLSDSDAGFRKYMKQSKRPPVRVAVYDSGSDLGRAAEPRTAFEATGYSLDVDAVAPVPGGFQDLDGDGRKDLVTITLDFSVFQAVRVLTTKSLSLGVDFHLWCQNDSGGFDSVEGLDLSGKFKFKLNDLRLGQLSQFAGDFDGDGRADFVQMGRGSTVSIHRGQPGCRYPAKPDLILRLDQAPRDLALVRVQDYDSDGLADLSVVQLRDADDELDGPSSSVELELYLSGSTW